MDLDSTGVNDSYFQVILESKNLIAKDIKVSVSKQGIFT